MSLPRAFGRTSVRLYATYRRLSSKAFSVAARGAFASFGARSMIELPVRLKGESRISVGSDVYIGAGSWLQVLDGPDRYVAITIGDGTSIAGNCVLSSTFSIRIGRSVLIARNVYVADHSHAFDDTTTPVLDQGVSGVEAVEIGDGAWLGQNVVVCPGVRIGRGAVVGANAVVLDDVPDFAVAVGAPARVVRELASREARA